MKYVAWILALLFTVSISWIAYAIDDPPTRMKLVIRNETGSEVDSLNISFNNQGSSTDGVILAGDRYVMDLSIKDMQQANPQHNDEVFQMSYEWNGVRKKEVVFPKVKTGDYSLDEKVVTVTLKEKGIDVDVKEQ